MKKLFPLLSVLFLLLYSCKSDDPATEPAQDYTSFQIWHNSDVTLTNVVSGYFAKDGKCILLGQHGDLSKGAKSPEFIMPEYHDSIYVFSDYMGTTMLDTIFTPKKHKKNEFFITENTKGINVEKNNTDQYPH